MFHKKVLVCLLLMSNVNLLNEVSKQPVEVSGEVNMADVNEKGELKLKLINPHPWAYLYVKIYNENTLIENRKVLSLAFEEQIYYLKEFDSYNQKTTYNIVINYYNNDQIDTKISFQYYSPTCKKNYVSGDTFTVRNSFPSKVTFTAQGNNCQTNYVKDSFQFTAAKSYRLDQTRYLDLSYFSITAITNTIELEVNEIEIRLFTKFIDSDLPYNGTYTTIYAETIKEGNTIYLANNYLYYLNRKNGSIHKEYKNDCYNQSYPFFFPLSTGFNKTFRYEVIFTNISSTLDSYILFGTMTLGEKLISTTPTDLFNEKYHYEINEDPIKEVTYTYYA